MNAGGAWPEVLAALFRRDLERVRAEVEAYPDDPSLWVLAGSVPNPGGTLAVHLAGNLHYFVGTVLGGGSYVRDRQREFTVRELSRAAVAAEVARATAAVVPVLEALDPGDLERPWPGPTPLGEGTSTGAMLAHLLGHLGYHLGQLNYHRRLLTPAGETSPV